MKRQIRHRVFETNSSSTHSVSVVNSNSDYADNSLSVGLNDNMVHTEFGEFGWGFEKYRGAKTKLSYAVTMVISTEGYAGYGVPAIDDKEGFYELEGFKLINDAVKERYSNCDGVVLDSDIELTPWSSDSNKYFLRHEGYIDHQSCEDYKSLKEFLDDYGVSIDEFLFNPRYVLYIMNDNSYREDREDFMRKDKYND